MRWASESLLAAGSARLLQTLTQCGLVDELRLLVYPVALGSDKRLFGANAMQKLSLVEAAPSSGVVFPHYRQAEP